MLSGNFSTQRQSSNPVEATPLRGSLSCVSVLIKCCFFIISFLATAVADAQSVKRSISLAILNTQSAKPFGTAAGFFSASLHPGFECSYNIRLQNSKHHEWMLEPRLQYFFHRFVQHGIPVYAAIDYRRHFGKKWTISSAIGGGYMFSIPATGRFQLNDAGEYVKDKSPWRSQATFSYEVRGGYSPIREHGPGFFITYQVRLQGPFVRSYVPLLPYNTLMIGCTFKLSNKSKPVI